MTVEIIPEEAPRAVYAENIYPRPQRYLARRLKKAEMTRGGIVLPAQAQEISQMGVVVMAGEKTVLPVGTWVLFSKYSETACIAASEYGADDLIFVREADILATIEFEPDELQEQLESTTEVVA